MLMIRGLMVMLDDWVDQGCFDVEQLTLVHSGV